MRASSSSLSHIISNSPQLRRLFLTFYYNTLLTSLPASGLELLQPSTHKHPEQSLWSTHFIHSPPLLKAWLWFPTPARSTPNSSVQHSGSTMTWLPLPSQSSWSLHPLLSCPTLCPSLQTQWATYWMSVELHIFPFFNWTLYLKCQSWFCSPNKCKIIFQGTGQVPSLLWNLS